jgi:putative transposase
MPRALRPTLTHGTYHLTARGVNGGIIFGDDEDRTGYFAMLRQHVVDSAVRVLAYVFMGNHVHLVLATIEANLSQMIRQLHGSYAARFNRKYHRTGHLFGGRFYSKPVTRDAYLLAVTLCPSQSCTGGAGGTTG